jgi:hypothetical protein
VEDFGQLGRLVRVIPQPRIIVKQEDAQMSEDRDRMNGQNEETEQEEVEAHRLAATEDPEQQDDDVEAHRLA